MNSNQCSRNRILNTVFIDNRRQKSGNYSFVKLYKCTLAPLSELVKLQKNFDSGFIFIHHAKIFLIPKMIHLMNDKFFLIPAIKPGLCLTMTHIL